ncbi:MAG TPA: hypothetical protein VF637_12010 [Sphingomicrobium sp.]
MFDLPDHGFHLARAEAEARAADRAVHELAREAHLALAQHHADRASALVEGRDEMRSVNAYRADPVKILVRS